MFGFLFFYRRKPCEIATGDMQSLATPPLIVKIVLECSVFGSTIIALVVCSPPRFLHLSHEKKRAFSNQKAWTVAE